MVCDDEGQIWPDLLQKAPGRGAYLCMQPDCFARLGDRQLSGGWRGKRSVAKGQAAAFRERLVAVLEEQCRRLWKWSLPNAAVGRDAVMHRMWKNAPLIVWLSVEAGDAVRRQVLDAVEKRRSAGEAVDVIDDVRSADLEMALGRERVSVAAIELSAQAERLKQFYAWLNQAKVSG